MAEIRQPRQARIEYPLIQQKPIADDHSYATAVATELEDGSISIDLNGTVIVLTMPEYDAIVALRSMIWLKRY